MTYVKKFFFPLNIELTQLDPKSMDQDAGVGKTKGHAKMKLEFIRVSDQQTDSAIAESEGVLQAGESLLSFQDRLVSQAFEEFFHRHIVGEGHSF